MKVYPLPEALSGEEGQGWSIKENIQTPMVDLKEKQMFVPLGDSGIDRCIRAHEQGHARWSPKTNPGPKHGIDPYIVNAVEDCRINTHLTRIGVDMSAGPMPKQQVIDAIRGLVAKQDLRNTVCGMMSAMGTSAFTTIDSIGIVPRDWIDIAKKAEHMINDGRRRGDADIPPITRVIKAAKWLNEIFDTVEAKQDQIEKVKKAESMSMPSGKDEKKGMDKELSAMPSSKELEAMLREMLDKAACGGSEADEWGDMVIETPSRTVGYSNELLGKKRRPYQEGSILRYPHRMAIDGAVFNLERSYPGASILIDGSGSMRWSDKDLEKIVEIAPAALIAVYDGWRRHGDGGRKNPKTGITQAVKPWGILKILVAGGRRVPDALMCRTCGGENVIDGPALVWLSRQPGPRYWISDGAVTGVSFSYHEANYRQCEKIMARYNIRQIESMDDCVEFFSKLKKRRA